MSIRVTTLLAAACLAASAQAAPVTGQISIGGYAMAIGSQGMGASTGIDFISGATGGASPGVAGGITSFGAASGSFASIGACANLAGGCGSIKDIQSYASSAPIASFLNFTGSPVAISFDLNAVTSITRTSDALGGSMVMTGTGIIHFAGLDNTFGAISLTAQGSNLTSFSATLGAVPAPVPEPGSFALMGLGGAALMLRSMRRQRASRMDVIG